MGENLNMAIIPQTSFIGSVTTLPENARKDQIIMLDGALYGYNGEDWIYLYGSKKSVTISELLDFLGGYEDSSLKQDILDLVESYRMCGYE